MIAIQPQVITSGYDRERCWVHARCARVPAGGGGNGPGRLVVTMQYSLMSDQEHVYDIFSGLYGMTSEDDGASWSAPCALPTLSRWRRGEDLEIAISDFTPQWLPVNGRLLGVGTTVEYRNNRRIKDHPRHEVAYCFYDAEGDRWLRPGTLELEGIAICMSGSVQWVELENGELLLPMAWKRPVDQGFQVSVLRCGVEGDRLTVLEQGPALHLPFARGLVEPSLTAWRGSFWLTLRNDYGAYLAVSADGLRYPEITPWHFCNGRPLGSYNTQQHWAIVEDRLFLVYTRAGLGNDHVVRHRAPLLIAEVDPARRCLWKETERVVVPERGAPLGNFGVSQDGQGRALICASEWMENAGAWNHEVWHALEEKFPGADLPTLAASPGRCRLCELSGADNAIHLVKVGTRAPSLTESMASGLSTRLLA